MIWNIYKAQRGHSIKVTESLSKGTGFPIVNMPSLLLDGGMITYGDGYGLQALILQCQDQCRPWVYIDRGYFKSGHYEGYYRVTKNAYQLQKVGNFKPDRWERLGLEIKPWREKGNLIIVCPPSPHLAGMLRIDHKLWTHNVVKELKLRTRKEILVRPKPSVYERTRNPIEALFPRTHALVTFASNAAIDALLWGIPIFMTSDRGAAYAYAEKDLSKIEKPWFPEGREKLMYSLAANQWTLEEMENGTCWRELTENQW